MFKSDDYQVMRSNYYFVMMMNSFLERLEVGADDLLVEITWKQYLLLFMVHDYYLEVLNRTNAEDVHNYPLITDLADNMGTSLQNVKKILMKLKAADFIDYISDPSDKKKQRIKLTPNGLVYIENRMQLDKVLFNKVFHGITESDKKKLVDNITHCTIVSDGSKPFTILTYDSKLISANQFRVVKIFPRSKNRPRYQIYASNGASIQLSGLNRHIIGFYLDKTEVEKELAGINNARNNKMDGYAVRYSVSVDYDLTGMPVIRKETS